MTERITRPPLYLRLSNPEQDEPLEAVIGEGNSHFPVDRGKWYCDAFAPNGLHVGGWLTSSSQDDIYLKVRKLFGDKSEDDLWQECAGRASATKYENSNLFICAWSDGCVLDRDAWTISRPEVGQPYLFQVNTKRGGKIDHLQIWASDGPSVLLACEDGANVVIVAGTKNSPAEIAPFIVSERSETSAYWGFVKNNVSSAAALLGQRIFAEMPRRPRADEVDQLLAAGHFAVAYSNARECRERIYPVLTKLRSNADAGILAWAIEFDDMASKERQPMLKSFVDVLKSIRIQRPKYSPVFRLLLERLSTAHTLFSTDKTFEALREEEDKNFGWTMRLGASTYWNSERLVFRGTEPGSPDPTASEPTLSNYLKKKRIRY